MKVHTALAGFKAVPLLWSNWNLEMMVFVEGGKLKKLGTNAQSNKNFNL